MLVRSQMDCVWLQDVKTTAQRQERGLVIGLRAINASSRPPAGRHTAVTRGRVELSCGDWMMMDDAKSGRREKFKRTAAF